MSLIFATQLTAFATAVLALFAFITAVLAAWPAGTASPCAIRPPRPRSKATPYDGTWPFSATA